MAASDNRRPSGGHTLFRYTAKDIDGRTVRGTMEAADYDALYAQLLEQGLYPQRVTGRGADRRPRTLRPQELSDLCRQLSTLLASGVSLVRALTIISQDEGISAGLRRVYESVLSEVRKGSSLSDALEAQQVFPALMLGMVRAGEGSGRLDRVAERLAVHYEKAHQMNQQVKSALMYPMILAVLSVAVVIVIVTFVLPQFSDLFSTMDSLPAVTLALMAFSDFMVTKWYLLLLGLAALAAALRSLLRVPSVRLALDRGKLTLPVFGQLHRIICTARFARTISSLYASGLPIITALQTARDTIGNAYIASQFDAVLAQVRRAREREWLPAQAVQQHRGRRGDRTAGFHARFHRGLDGVRRAAGEPPHDDHPRADADRADGVRCRLYHHRGHVSDHRLVQRNREFGERITSETCKPHKRGEMRMNTTVLALQEEQVLAAVGRPGAKPSVQALYRAPAHGGGMENWERAVGALWQAHDLPTRGITLVLPDEAVTTHTVTAPRMPESRLEELVQHEMRAHDGQPVAADYLPLGTDADGRQQLFCAACRKETMAGYLAMADRLGLHLGSVTVPMAGRLRLLRAMPSLQSMTFVCLCFEGSSVLSLLVENGAYRYSSRSRVFSEPGTLDFGTEMTRSVSGTMQFCG